MTAHRLPLFGKPIRYGRLLGGFYKIEAPPAPPPEGLPTVAQWPLDTTSWEDTVGTNDLADVGSTAATLTTGYLNSAAEFPQGALLSALVGSMNLRDWEIELYVYFDSFDDVDTVGTTRILTLGTPFGDEEWSLSLISSYAGPSAFDHSIYLSLGFLLGVTIPDINTDTWYLLRFGLEVNGPLSPTPYRCYISKDGGPEQSASDETAPPENPEGTDSYLYFGSFSGYTISAGMRIDEVILRQEPYVPPVFETTSDWPLNDTSWEDILAGYNLSATGTVSLITEGAITSAGFTDTSFLSVAMPSFMDDNWELSFKVKFDLANYDPGYTESSIIGFTGGLNEIWLMINIDYKLTFYIGETALYSSVILSSNTWYDVAIGLRRIAGEQYLVLDGSEITTSNAAYPGPFTGTLILGYRNSSYPCVDGMQIDALKLKQNV